MVLMLGKRQILIIGVVATGALIGVGFLSYHYVITTQKLEATQQTLASTTEALVLQERESLELSEALYSEQQKNIQFQQQIQSISETVGSLEKLTTIDPELLQKYSKVYFLNEHYMPEELVEVTAFTYEQEEKDYYFHKKVWPYLQKLLEDASKHRLGLRVISAFRSFDEQAELKGEYLVTFGSGANTFSADQGYSEHQLGTTVDFTTESLGTNFEQFETTEAYTWLQNNAHRYGFVLSYPEGNKYYQFEPWHWRFVGVELATELYNSERNFYDLDQRDIDEYLINFFD